MTHTQTSLATGADPHVGDPGGLSMENAACRSTGGALGANHIPRDQVGPEERVARAWGRQGQIRVKARHQHKSCSLVPQMDGPTMGLFFQVADFEIILAREPLSLQNKINPRKSLE